MVRRKSSARSLNERTNPTHHSEKTGSGAAKKAQGKGKPNVLQEIKHLRQSTDFLIPKRPFIRLVKEVMFELFPRQHINRMQVRALEALQEASEMYVTQFFEDSMLLAIHAKRVTLMRNDMVLMRRLRGRDDVINK
ncbi:hypothetical protein KM043_015739 [Ampulex compressa]|nr:hypothetical protein KM043_015739 [Ampulex compressa]